MAIPCKPHKQRSSGCSALSAVYYTLLIDRFTIFERWWLKYQKMPKKVKIEPDTYVTSNEAKSFSRLVYFQQIFWGYVTHW